MLFPTPTPTAALAALGVLALPPAPTVFVRELQPRGEYDDLVSCAERIAELPCLADLTSCVQNENDNAVLTACKCSYAAPNMKCVSSAVNKGHCSSYFSLSTLDADWFLSHCAGPVPTALLPVTTRIPSGVEIDYRPASIVTVNLTSPPFLHPHTDAPWYASTDSILRGDCGATRYKLLEDTHTVYWAAYVGCGMDLQGCCPWVASQAPPVSTDNITAAATADAAATLAVPFPVPARDEDRTLARCPADYTNAAGLCCPTSYWPFPSALGDSGHTPCYMSLARATEPPVLTVNRVPGQPLDTDTDSAGAAATAKPTSAVVNLVWTMSYPAPAPPPEHKKKSGLSSKAIGGIVVGVVLAIAIVVLVTLCVRFYRGRGEPWAWKCPGRGKKAETELPRLPSYKPPTELERPPPYVGPSEPAEPATGLHRSG